MSVGDIIQVKLKGRYTEQLVMNTFYYQQIAGGTGNATGNLNVPFEDQVLLAMAALATTDMTWQSIEYVNGMNNSDYYEEFNPDSVAGSRTVATPAPSFIAMSFRSNRTGPGTRYGYKRFCGFNNEDYVDNQWVSGLDTLRATLADKLALTLTNATYQFKPCVLRGGFKLGVNPVMAFQVTSWSSSDDVTTQLTRKLGRGA